MICKGLDVRFPSLSREIATRHSSHGGEFGERIDSIKDAIGRSEERPSQATGYGTGFVARVKLTFLPESTPPRRSCSAHGMNGEI
jgi:hypothetical protein